MSDNDAAHAQFMRLAIDQSARGAALGNLGVGSVIVRDGEVIGRGYNTALSDGDPTNHAEVVAIRHACSAVASAQLRGATLYSAMEPCPMCAWAICMVGIKRLVLGARHATFHRPEMGAYSVERLVEMTGAQLEVVSGVLQAECEALRPELSRR